MLPVEKELRDKLSWFINEKPLKNDQWVCMSYMGRNSHSKILPDGFALADLKIEFPRDVFIEIYKRYYDKVVEEERNDETYEWGELPEWDQVRELNYPPFEELIADHTELAIAVISENDIEIGELIYMEPKSDPKNGFSLKILNQAKVTGNTVSLLGKVLYKVDYVKP
ncbi:hypothetical protein [Sessilibacter sp. MAH4]